MKTYKKIIIVLNLMLLSGYFIHSINSKESILKHGKLVLLDLAPVDPRSLMQGDYMTLRYAETRGFSSKEDSLKRGYCIVTLDEKGIGKRVRLQEHLQPLNEAEYAINFTKDRWNLNIGAESYFFEEGQAEKYDSARYGGLRIDDEGHSLLVGLYNENLKLIH